MESVEDFVSILVPVFNGERFIARTLDSLLAQTHGHFEIVVVDDGSTDDTAAILDAFAKGDTRIKVFRTARRGPPGARNHAARQARGAFLAPCDSDDLWHPLKLEYQLGALRQASSAVGVAYCWSVGINFRDEIIFPSWARHEVEGNVLHETIAESLTGSGSVPLIRRELFDAVGGFPEDIYNGDEWQICIALAGICEFVVVRQYLVAYRLVPGSTSTDHHSLEESLARTTRWIAERWPDLPRNILRRREYTVNSYLAFVTLRNGNFRLSLKYQCRAFASQHTRIVSRSLLDYYLRIWAQVLKIDRSYYRFWQRPRRWQK